MHEYAAQQTPHATGLNTAGHTEALLQAAVTEALACMDAGQTAKACAHIDEVQHLAATSAMASYVFGLFYFDIGDCTLALQWFERALVLRPNFTEARTGRAIALHKLGRPIEALAPFDALSRDDIAQSIGACLNGCM